MEVGRKGKRQGVEGLVVGCVEGMETASTTRALPRLQLNGRGTLSSCAVRACPPLERLDTLLG